jgi:hypothetical protein
LDLDGEFLSTRQWGRDPASGVLSGEWRERVRDGFIVPIAGEKRHTSGDRLFSPGP